MSSRWMKNLPPMALAIAAACAAPVPLHDAARMGNREYATMLIQQGHPINGLAYDGTPLALASLSCDAAMVQHLLDLGADPSAGNPDGYNSRTALHSAAKSGCIEAARLLLERGANKTITNREGLTPAQMARQEGHPQFATFVDDYRPEESLRAGERVARLEREGNLSECKQKLLELLKQCQKLPEAAATLCARTAATQRKCP